MKQLLMTACMMILLATLCGCTGLTSPVGLASARQQTKTVSVYIELTGIEPVAGTPLISWTEGAMTYDGTRGDVAKNKAGGDIADNDTVTLPLPQAAGASITQSVLSKLYGMVDKDKTETVPAGLNMSLSEWKLLKASYIECPECLALSPAEAAALEKATGITYPNK
jgi:hypothetical protein